MRKLVRDQRDQALVADDDGRRRERHARILHAAEREARRQYEHVVAAPAIRAVELFGRLDHRLGVGEFLRGRIDDRRFGVDGAARAGRPRRDVADRDREQVRRDGVVHREREFAVQRMRGVVRRAHDRAQRLRHVHARGVREAHRRRVLERNPAARVDRFGLREHERLLLSGRLRGRHPLQARRVGRRSVADAHGRNLRVEADAQRGTEDRIAPVERERHRPRRARRVDDFDGADVQIARIEDDLACRRVLPVERKLGRADEAALIEVDAKIERNRTHDDLSRVRVTVGIDRGGDRGHAPRDDAQQLGCEHSGTSSNRLGTTWQPESGPQPFSQEFSRTPTGFSPACHVHLRWERRQ